MTTFCLSPFPGLLSPQNPEGYVFVASSFFLPIAVCIDSERKELRIWVFISGTILFLFGLPILIYLEFVCASASPFQDSFSPPIIQIDFIRSRLPEVGVDRYGPPAVFFFPSRLGRSTQVLTADFFSGRSLRKVPLFPRGYVLGGCPVKPKTFNNVVMCSSCSPCGFLFATYCLVACLTPHQKGTFRSVSVFSPSMKSCLEKTLSTCSSPLFFLFPRLRISFHFFISLCTSFRQPLRHFSVCGQTCSFFLRPPPAPQNPKAI